VTGRIPSKDRFGRYCACLKRDMGLVIWCAYNLNWMLPDVRPNLLGKYNFLASRCGRSVPECGHSVAAQNWSIRTGTGL